MLIELKDYAPHIGIVPGAVRKRIHKANQEGKSILEVLPYVKEAKKYGKTWVFEVEENLFKKGKINLE